MSNTSQFFSRGKNVLGTLNRIISTESVNAFTIDIASNYIGQSSITTLGTITSGVWNATTIGVNKGGTGLITAGTNGQILMSNGSGWVLTTPSWISSIPSLQQVRDVNKNIITTASGAVNSWINLTTINSGSVSLYNVSNGVQGIQTLTNASISGGTLSLQPVSGLLLYNGIEVAKITDIPGPQLLSLVGSNLSISSGNTVTFSKSTVGLGNVDNTADLDKPISNATQTALNLKANNNQVVHLTGNESISNIKTFTTSPKIPDAINLDEPVTLSQLQDAIDGVAIGDFIPITEKAAANGVATLDANTKIPIEQIPFNVFIYKGTWNASTNTPTLIDGVGVAGWVYKVNTAGIRDLGSGPISFNVNDLVIYNGTTWENAGNDDAVISVNGQTGAVSLTTSNIPEGSNLYYTNGRSRNAISVSGNLSYNSTTGVISYTTPTSLPPSGPAGGNLSGTYPNPVVSLFNNQLPSYYLDRANQTGVQAINTITGLQTALNGKEDLINKVTNLLSPNNTTYPTTQAIINAGFLTSESDPIFQGSRSGIYEYNGSTAGFLTSGEKVGSYFAVPTTTGNPTSEYGTVFNIMSVGSTIDNFAYLNQLWFPITSDYIYIRKKLGSNASSAWRRLAFNDEIPAQLNLSGSSNIVVSGTYPNLTISATGLGSGSVTSVGVSSTDLTVSGSPITSSGTISLTLPNINSNIGTFNNLTVNAKGQVTGGSNANYLLANQTITFTPQVSGDVTGTSSGSTSLTPILTIGNNKVTLAKLAQISSPSLLGRYTTGTGNVQVISLGSGLNLDTTTGILSAIGSGGTVTSITGTTNRVTVINNTTTPTIDIASNYVGQSSINTLGTISTGIWAASPIQIPYGGTGLTSAGSNGQVLVSNGTSWVLTTPPWLSTIPNLQQVATSGNTYTGGIGLSGGSIVSGSSLSLGTDHLTYISNGSPTWNTKTVLRSSYDIVLGDYISLEAPGAGSYTDNWLHLYSDGAAYITEGRIATRNWVTSQGYTTNLGTVTNVSGTTNRISISNNTTTPIIDIASNYIGQGSITTLGTISTGIWNANTIGVLYGGTGLNTLGTANQLLRVNSGASALEYFTPTWLTTESDPVFTASIAASITSTNVANWNNAYDNQITSVSVTGTSTKTLTLTQHDGGTLSTTFSDDDTDTDTNFGNTDILFTGNRTHDLNSDSMVWVNGDYFEVNANSVLLNGGTTTGLQVGNTDVSISANGGNIMLTTAVHEANLKTTNLTTSRFYEFPDKNGTIKVYPNYGIPTLTAQAGWTITGTTNVNDHCGRVSLQNISGGNLGGNIINITYSTVYTEDTFPQVSCSWGSVGVGVWPAIFVANVSNSLLTVTLGFGTTVPSSATVEIYYVVHTIND